ncbi:hypothetical protein G3N56_07775 [Desulfovibrio sulfodismutans]|uniref:Uncharacterized protein n=1 Tax=Desulfolutivibrio sulfodismutans TaxID=63561 RepID=A0A7K3NKD4_9BACT|nr:hypothetical protein [Desulfolutivibrio sulfodismutans]NDY56640.1 hypothetical protein [Desulfolutivibrio sulfodismutans]QLA11259.1 hypothetical protein GD606_02680 [Desulfolutivibrio sulfodismutans DSM 3696]
MGTVAREITARHSLIAEVAGEVTAVHAVIAQAVAREITARHEIGGTNPVACEVTTGYALTVADSLAVTCAVVLNPKSDAPRALDPVAVSIFADSASYCWSLTLTLRDLADWRRCAPGSPVEVTVDGQAWAFVLESRSRDRSFGSTGYTAAGRSPTIALDAPLATAVTKTWGRITALAAAQELCDAAGVGLSWEVCSWTLPAGRLTADEQSPIEILSALAAACGAVLQSTPAGDLRVVYAYPVPVTEMAEAEPALTLSDVDHIFTASESYEYREGYDAVVVTDAASDSGDGSIQISVDTDRTGKSSFAPGDTVFLRVTASVPYTLRATSGILALVEAGVVETPEAETIDFAQEETAGADKSVSTVEDYEWHGLAPGAIVPDGAGGMKLAAGAGFGVATVEYTTKYDLWQYTPGDLGEAFPALILAEEITS